MHIECLLLSGLVLAGGACGAPPDKVAIYPGFTYEQMSKLEPGTGEYLRKHGVVRLDPISIEIVDPTTSRPFLSLENSIASLSSNGRVLTMATTHSPKGSDRATTHDALVRAVRAFIDRGWRCHANDSLDGPVVDASAITLPERFCVDSLDQWGGWTCSSPPAWIEATAFFKWSCGKPANDFTFGWSLEMVASRD